MTRPQPNRAPGGAWHWIALLALILLAGCTLTSSERAREPADVRAEFAARLAEAQTDQAAALALWDRVIFGEMVACQEAIPVPAPVALSAQDQQAHPAAVPIQDALNTAIQAVRDSADLWNSACAMPDPAIPVDLAREGRAAALRAGPALETAAALLAVWPWSITEEGNNGPTVGGL